MADAHLKFNVRSSAWATDQSEFCAAALEMATSADRIGVDAIRIAEHHCHRRRVPAGACGLRRGGRGGHLPDLPVAAGVPAATPRSDARRRTSQCWTDSAPVVSRWIVGGGYRPDELALFGIELKDRAGWWRRGSPRSARPGPVSRSSGHGAQVGHPHTASLQTATSRFGRELASRRASSGATPPAVLPDVTA